MRDARDRGAIQARKLILAYGVADSLPDIPGLSERWGQTVLHCPYCHGYELPGRQAVIAVGPMSAHQAMLITEWGPTTLFTNGCALEQGMLGTYLRTDAMRATTVRGVFAAGDITREMHNATFAAADGVMAGMSAHRKLVFDLARA